MKLEALQGRWFADFADCQKHLCQWRSLYNLERPHEACDLQPPVSRYQVSARAYPEKLPLPEYPSTDHVRSVGKDGRLRFKGREWNLAQAFKGHKVGLRQTMQDGVWDVWFHSIKIGQINLSKEQ